MRKLVTDMKVIPGEEVSLQVQLLVCDMQMARLPKTKHKFFPPLKVWRLKDPETCTRFQEVFKEHMLFPKSTAEEVWAKLKTGLLKTTGEVCGTTCPHLWRHEAWWWSEEVEGLLLLSDMHLRRERAQRRPIARPSA